MMWVEAAAARANEAALLVNSGSGDKPIEMKWIIPTRNGLEDATSFVKSALLYPFTRGTTHEAVAALAWRLRWRTPSSKCCASLPQSPLGPAGAAARVGATPRALSRPGTEVLRR